MVLGSNPAVATFSVEHRPFLFTPLCQCLSEETLEAVDRLDRRLLVSPPKDTGKAG